MPTYYSPLSKFSPPDQVGNKVRLEFGVAEAKKVQIWVEQVHCPLLDVDAFRAERSFNCPRVNRFAKIWFQNFTGARPHRNRDVTPAPDKV